MCTINLMTSLPVSDLPAGLRTTRSRLYKPSLYCCLVSIVGGRLGLIVNNTHLLYHILFNIRTLSASMSYYEKKKIMHRVWLSCYIFPKLFNEHFYLK